jgi:hypothetical protein
VIRGYFSFFFFKYENEVLILDHFFFLIDELFFFLLRIPIQFFVEALEVSCDLTFEVEFRGGAASRVASLINLFHYLSVLSTSSQFFFFKSL